jgi:PAS domain S-box-containing protein
MLFLTGSPLTNCLPDLSAHSPVSSASSEESKRLEILEAYGIMNTTAEEEFNSITRLAALVCNTPIALITFVDHERQWFKSKVGLALQQTPRSQAFCHYTIQGADVLEVPDAQLDERFLNNPLVTGDPHIRYYCGVPLTTPEGYRLGSLCVIDRQPRQLDVSRQEALLTLAGEVMAQLELKRQKQKLEEQTRQMEFNEAQYRALFEESEGYLFTHNFKGIILAANGAAIKALGYRKDDLIGKDLSRFLVLRHPSPLADYLTQTQAGQTISGVIRVVTAGGEERYWQYRNFPSYRASGEPYVICSAHDVTDKEKLARTMRKAKEELEKQVQLRTRELQVSNTALTQAKAELNTFLYRASHDLRGPLCSIEGLLGLARVEENPLEQRQYLELMQQMVRKLNRMLESLLSYTLNTHNSLTTERVDFESVVTRTLDSLRDLRGFERVKVQTHIETATPFYSDAERLFSILKSEIGNSITFQNYALEEPAVTIWITCSPGEAAIVVDDNGVGIAEENLDAVFRMFTRSSSQSTGSGLGMYIVKQTVERLGGRISLQSREGKGTQVSVQLPNLRG